MDYVKSLVSQSYCNILYHMAYHNWGSVLGQGSVLRLREGIVLGQSGFLKVRLVGVMP